MSGAGTEERDIRGRRSRPRSREGPLRRRAAGMDSCGIPGARLECFIKGSDRRLMARAMIHFLANCIIALY